MANAAVNVSFLENSIGGRTLVHNDFMYRLKTQKGERSYWYCVQPTCPARINLLHDISTKISMNHNHENNPTGTKVISVMNSIRKRVRESTKSVQAIYEDLLCSARSTEWDDTTEVVKNIPTFYFSRSSLYRHRSKLHPALPNTRDEIVVDGEWKETLTSENFLLADDTVDERILIFATEDNLTELSYADVWYMDGTFYSSPNCFYQLYTIHAQINEQMYPLVYGFLPNKTRATYRRFFSSLQTAADNQNIHLLPDIIMMDFEKPAQTTATEVFSSATIRGCFFSILRNVYGEKSSPSVWSESLKRTTT